MAARSVLVSIAVLVICSCYGCTGDRGTEGQPGATQGEASGAKTSPRPAGKAGKLALLVGINKYKAVDGLSGCVADVRNMQGLLRGKFDFPDPTGLQVLKKCRVSGRRHFCHPTSFQGRGCENGRSTEDPASGS